MTQLQDGWAQLGPGAAAAETEGSDPAELKRRWEQGDLQVAQGVANADPNS